MGGGAEGEDAKRGRRRDVAVGARPGMAPERAAVEARIVEELPAGDVGGGADRDVVGAGVCGGGCGAHRGGDGCERAEEAKAGEHGGFLSRE